MLLGGTTLLIPGLSISLPYKNDPELVLTSEKNLLACLNSNINPKVIIMYCMHLATKYAYSTPLLS